MTTQILNSRLPLEDYDPNSQDSGYGALCTESDGPSQKSKEVFRFAEPSGLPPRRLCSMNSPIRSSPNRARRPRSNLANKISSGYDSMDDGFNELSDLDNFMENVQIMPNGLRNLISGEIVSIPEETSMECDDPTTPECPRTRPLTVRRSLNLQEHPEVSCTSPPTSKIRSCLFRSPNATSSASKLTFVDYSREEIYSSPSSPPFRTFKRPEPPTDASPVLVKRSRPSPSSIIRPNDWPVTAKTSNIARSQSEPASHLLIKSAITRSTTDADLTGDFSKSCILPLEEGQHEDLKSISSETLVSLIRGDFVDNIDSFQIVDCRYPYEYEDGHIKGAFNLYSKDLIEEYLIKPMTESPQIQSDELKRNILIFHCEFSWERGPNLSRYLRNIDRKMNKDCYPALHYPEIYLLHGGYKEFYRNHVDFCTPQGYRPMSHPENEEELRKFRSRGKSWNSEKSSNSSCSRVGLTARTSFKRLGF